MSKSLKHKRKLSEYPEKCLTFVEGQETLGLILRGQKGFSPLVSNQPVIMGGEMFIRAANEELAAFARRVNDAIDIDKEMERDMVGCSMFNLWPEPERIVVDLMSNIDTPEKTERLEELIRLKKNTDHAILMFCLHYEKEVFAALQLLRQQNVDLEDFDEDEDGNSISIEKAFLALIKEHKIATDRFQYFACRGEERPCG